VRSIPTQMCKTQQCAERNNGKKVFLQENGGKENFVGFLKSVEYNNPRREKGKVRNVRSIPTGRMEKSCRGEMCAE
jgi:hypothetical protein